MHCKLCHTHNEPKRITFLAFGTRPTYTANVCKNCIINCNLEPTDLSNNCKACGQNWASHENNNNAYLGCMLNILYHEKHT